MGGGAQRRAIEGEGPRNPAGSCRPLVGPRSTSPQRRGRAGSPLRLASLGEIGKEPLDVPREHAPHCRCFLDTLPSLFSLRDLVPAVPWPGQPCHVALPQLVGSAPVTSDPSGEPGPAGPCSVPSWDVVGVCLARLVGQTSEGCWGDSPGPSSAHLSSWGTSLAATSGTRSHRVTTAHCSQRRAWGLPEKGRCPLLLPAVPAPSGIAATLRPNQIEGQDGGVTLSQ